MKKRVLSIITALALCLALLPVSVLAEESAMQTPITGIIEIALNAPSAGMQPVQVQASLISDGEYTIGETVWTKLSGGVESVDTFEMGSEYAAEVTITANEGYKFEVSDIQVSCANGSPNQVTCNSDTPGYLKIGVWFTVSEAVPEPTARTLSFAEAEIQITYGSAETVSNPLSDSLADEEDAPQVMYSSSNSGVASVDVSSGIVTIHNVGTVAIYANADADETFAAASASYLLTVTKAAYAGPTATLSSDELEITHDSIVVKAPKNGYEYACAVSGSQSEWTASGNFTGLLPNTEYQIYARLAETDNYYASEASAPCTVTTLKYTQKAPSALTASDLTVTADSITVNAPKSGYEYACTTSGGELVWGTDGSFTGLSPNTKYKIYTRIAATDSYDASEASAPCTVTTPKYTQEAPAALTASDLTVTANRITVNAPESGYEYACTTSDGELVWTADGSFTGLQPNTEYQVYVRLAETETHSASAASEPCEVKTAKLTRPSSGSSNSRPSGGASDKKPGKIEATTNSDGSVTTTETAADGSVTETTRYTDGSTNVFNSQRDGTLISTETDANGCVTKTVHNTDGTVTITKTEADGTVTETVENRDGTVKLTVATPEGTKAEGTIDSDGIMNVTVTVTPDSDPDDDGATTLPIPALNAAQEGRTADTITISTGGAADEVTVTIPVEGASAVTVAVIVNPDGTETIIRSVFVDENTTVTVPDGATLKFINREVEFEDVSENDWFKDAVDFATSHELFSGTSETEFSPDGTMTRGMLATVLHNLANNPDAGSEADVRDTNDQYYADAAAWAAAEGIISGYGDGQYGAEETVSREQLAVMLYRFAERPSSEEAELSSSDAEEATPYAREALQWALENNVMSGDRDGNLMPKSDATRAQVASTLMRFCKNV